MNTQKNIVGRVLRKELAARGMSIQELAERTHYSLSHLYHVLGGQVLVGWDLAVALGKEFGTSAEIWYRLGRDE